MTPLPTVFTQPSCQPCKAVKRWLEARGIMYFEVDISESPEDLEFIKELGFMQAPVVRYEDGGVFHNFSGFNPGELEKLEAALDPAA